MNSGLKNLLMFKLNDSLLKLPDSRKVKAHIINSLESYWISNSSYISKLPIRNLSSIRIKIPLKLISISLPKWAQQYGIGGEVLVPQELVEDFDKNGFSYTWEDIDWFLACFLMLECWHERIWEENFGPIHSYSFRLKGWDSRAWDYAWVNRIALFLKSWSINLFEQELIQHQPIFPLSNIHFTHDVDAVKKTIPIRIKQSIFELVNSIKLIPELKFSSSKGKLLKAIKFLISNDDWWVFENLLNFQRENEIKAIYYFSGIQKNRGFISWLIDPSYDISSEKIKNLVNKISHDGHIIGLHPSFDSWRKTEELLNQKKLVERVTSQDLIKCRQHWLRFSWRDTWTSQFKAGLGHDATLMFNDRPGFRNSTAISWCPWNHLEASAHKIIAEPTMFMDSHFYNYNQMSDNKRRKTIYKFIYECRVVSGTASLLWHTHSMSKDYGWTKGYHESIEFVKELYDSI